MGWEPYKPPWCTLTDRWSWSHSLVKTRVAFAVRGLLWPARKWALRRVKAIEELARERGGDPPGPSWKVRHEFGTPAGD